MRREAFRRAVSYPYDIPARSYIVTGAKHRELDTSAPMPDLAGRRPVLAVGSNQSPDQLIRKFKDLDLGPIPVIRARLADFDIVYSSHVASYGSIPAMLRHSPGTRVTLFVNWLTPEQERRMHATETATENYGFGMLDGIELSLELGDALTSAFVYAGRRGSLMRDGLPVALAAVEAEGRVWPSMTQEQIQHLVRDRLAPGEPLEAFVQAAVGDAAVRRARTEALMADSVAFDFFGFTPIDI